MLLGRKLGMTQIYQEDGSAVAVTVVQAGPCVVLQKKGSETNGGHNAVQLGFEPVKDKNAANFRLSTITDPPVWLKITSYRNNMNH